jgi:type IV secretory pathway VirB10-like protein
LTGGKKPQATPKGGPLVAATPAPLEVNETKINELQNRIEELQRDQLVAQSALAQQTRLIANSPQDSQAAESGTSQPAGKPEDPEQTEKKRRAYVSLFASNVALSYRKGATAPAVPEVEAAQSGPSLAPVAPTAPDVAQLVKEMQQGSTSAPPAKEASDANRDRKEELKNPAAVAPGVENAATGKPYLLFEGTILESVLINRLDGSFAGPVECLLSTDVYSNDRQHLLIPAGSKLIGETKKVDTLGQSRLAVAFHRLIMPDGYSVSLDQFKGLNQIGDTGLRDQVNNHYARIFGVSLAIGALGAIGEAGAAGGLNASTSDLLRQGFAQSTAQSSAQILDKFLNIMPTVTIREGHRIKVFLSGDLALPEYQDHKMPSNL